MYYQILQRLTSRKLAVVLLLFIIVLFVAGSFFPKVSFMSTPQQQLLAQNNPWLYRLANAVTPPEIVKTWVFALLTGALFLSTACCSGVRIQRALNRRERGNLGLPLVRVVLPGRATEDDWTDKIEQLLRTAKWEVNTAANPSGGKVIHAGKGKKGFWGSILFHTSILIIILGGLLSMYAAFYAGVVITEGQTLDVVEENLVDVSRLPKMGLADPGFQMRLESFAPYLEQGRFFTQYFANVSFLDPRGGEARHEEVKINHTAGFRGFTVALSRYGFAPWLLVTDNETGQVLVDSYVNLVVPDPASSDSVALPPGYSRLMFRMFPDAQVEGRKIKNRSPLPNKPVLVVWTEGEEEKHLSLGGKVKFPKVTVQFADLRYWASFRLGRDPGEPVIYLGFGLGILGLLIRFLDPRKTLWLTLLSVDGQAELAIGGHSHYFPALFQDEIRSLAGHIERELKG